jgi:hypothetical protein
MHVRSIHSSHCRRGARGLTLLESLIAAGILFGVVTAVTAAITAGQQHALEAQERVAAVLAAEGLMGRIIAEDYDDLASWNGYLEAVGSLVDEYGQPMPEVFGTIGCEVDVDSHFTNVTPPNVNIQGRLITVRAFNASGRVLIELTRFIAEPASS